MLARLIDPGSLTRERIVVRFDLTDRSKPNRYWLVASRTGNEVCAEYPGFAEDGLVVTDARWLVRWHSGQVNLLSAQRANGIILRGPRWLTRSLSEWGALSPFAEASRNRYDRESDPLP